MEMDMNVKLNVSAEDIENHVKEAVLASVVGESLKTEIESAVEEALKGTYNRDSAVKRLTKIKVDEIIRDTLEGEQYRSTIETVVRESMTDEVVREIASNVTRHLIETARR